MKLFAALAAFLLPLSLSAQMTTVDASQVRLHGTGLIPFRPVARYAHLNTNYYADTGGWTGYGSLGPHQGGNIADVLSIVAPSGWSTTFTAGQPFDHLRMYCTSGTTAQPWTLSIDGVAQGTACGQQSGPDTSVVVSSNAVPLGLHGVTINCVTGPCIGGGVEAVAGTTGVSVHNLSVARHRLRGHRLRGYLVAERSAQLAAPFQQ